MPDLGGAHRRLGAPWVLLPSLAVLLFLPMRYSLSAVSGHLTPSVLFGVAMLLLWAGFAIVPRSGLARGTQPVRLAVLFLLWSAAASYLALDLRPVGDVEVRAAQAGLAVLAAGGGMALLTADGLANRREVGLVVRFLVAGMAGVAIVALLQFRFGFDPYAHLSIPGLPVGPDGATYVGERSALRRVGGTASHPIELGVVLATTVPLALHAARYARPGWRRLGWWLCVALIGLAVPTSVSRSGVVCLATAGLVLVVGWTWRERLQAAAALAAGLALVRLAVPGLLGTTVALFTNIGTDPSIQHRTADYTTLLPYVQETPLLGRGFGTFIPTQYDPLLGGYPFVDNQYLQSLVENGVVGLLALACLLGCGMALALAVRRGAPDRAGRDLATSMVAALAAAAVGFATFDALSFQIIRTVVFVLVGCAGALWRLQRVARVVPLAAPPAPGLAVATVTYQSAELLPGFFRSLRRALALHPGARLIVVDSGSRDGSADLARRLAPDATVIRMGRNAGYAAGINRAIEAAPPDVPLLVLNPDVGLRAGAVDALLAALAEPGVGIAVPCLLDSSGRLIHSLRREPTVLRALGEALLGGRAGRVPALGEVVQDGASYRAGVDADWASGAAMLLRRECLDDVGPWDESFFLYSEETDFALRAAVFDWRVRHVPAAVAVHSKPGSAPTSRLWTILTVNRVRLYRRYHSGAATAAFASAVALGEAIRAVDRRGRDRHREALRALLFRSRRPAEVRA